MAVRLPTKSDAASGETDTARLDLLTVRQAAAFVSVSEVTIRRWLRARYFRSYRAGAQIRIDRKDLVAFLDQY